MNIFSGRLENYKWSLTINNYQLIKLSTTYFIYRIHIKNFRKCFVLFWCTCQFYIFVSIPCPCNVLSKLEKYIFLFYLKTIWKLNKKLSDHLTMFFHVPTLLYWKVEITLLYLPELIVTQIQPRFFYIYNNFSCRFVK